MNMRTVKNLFFSMILLLLIALSVFQTKKLWFDDLSDRNFFYSDIYNESDLIGNVDADILKPNKIIASYSETPVEFSVIKNTSLYFNKIQRSSVRYIAGILKNVERVELTNIDETKFLGKTSLVLQYPFVIKEQLFEEQYNVGNNVEVDEIGGIQQIVILPSKHTNEATVFFLNYNTNKMYELYSSYKSISAENDNIVKIIQGTKESAVTNYISTSKDGLSKFKKNIFLPVKNQNYYRMTLNNPFKKGQLIDEEKLKEYLKGFFQNINDLWHSNEKEFYMCGDGRVTVKFKYDGIIEYVDKSISSYKKNTTISEAYKIASAFLLKDSLLEQQEFYLDKCVESKEGIHFYFNYRFNDYEYFISEDLKTQLRIDYPIEIVVDGNNVKLYKRLIFDKNINNMNIKQVKDTYINALNRLYIEKPECKNEYIDDMFLAYYHDELSKGPHFGWVILINEKRYFLKVN